MTIAEHRRKQREKLALQKLKPMQKISNTFIDSTINKNNIGAIKTVFYLATVLDDFDFNKDIDLIKIDLQKMLKYTDLTARDVRYNLKAMQETSISFINEELQEELMINLLPWIDFQWGKNVIEIKLFSKIARMIIDVKKNYTFINTKQLMRLKNKNSIRMLPLLNRINQYDEHIPKLKRFELEEINELFGTNYKKFTDLERKVLIPIKEELDTNSHLSFIYDINFVNLGVGRPKAKD
ncbi:MAG: replication initiation protein, partial [Arcobacteraceae bacterium]|nr:replication initiation protein [Arcobacteraceae bacterium]